MRSYKVLLPLTVHREDGAWSQGETFEAEFSAEHEDENLKSGLLELQPLKYKVVGESIVHGHEPGEEFEMALPLGEEQLLIEGGHLERVEEKPAAKKPTRKKKGG